MSRFEAVYPFCFVVEHNESPSSITAVSIQCLCNLLNSSFIALDAVHCAECIQLIGTTICSVILDVEQKEFDEGLLLKFLYFIQSLLGNECVVHLSESSMWNLFEKSLYIYFNVNAHQHSEALFEAAEITVTLLIRSVFKRYVLSFSSIYRIWDCNVFVI